MEQRPTLLQRIFRASPENPSTSLAKPASWLYDLFFKSKTGEPVNEQSAMAFSAVFAATRIISETIASLPLDVYERQGQSRIRLTDHPLAKLIKEPNGTQTDFVWKEYLQACITLHGNAYCHIQRDAAARPIALHPIHPSKVQVKVHNGEKFYVVNDKETYADYEMLHFLGLSLDGITGISVLGAAREAIGIGLAAQQFGAEFFGNGANLGGILTHPGRLTDDAAKRLKDSWTRSHSGLNKAHSTAVLEEGMRYERVGIPPNEAQFIETRKLQVTEIARIFRVPPHMLADLDASSTRANIEEQGISFVRDTIRPIVSRWEAELDRKLLREDEKGTLYTRFNLDSLLRGDTKSRFESYATARQWGWLSVNDIRDLENLNPIDGGDVYLQPLNMVNASIVPNDGQVDAD